MQQLENIPINNLVPPYIDREQLKAKSNETHEMIISCNIKYQYYLSAITTPNITTFRLVHSQCHHNSNSQLSERNLLQPPF